MVEWHVTPNLIINNWTDELLDLMMKNLIKRKEREVDAMQSPRETVKPDKFAENPYFGNTDFIKVVKN